MTPQSLKGRREKKKRKRKKRVTLQISFRRRIVNLLLISAGNCGNSFGNENGNLFSTVDQDNDKSPVSCAQKFKSGWWHGKCHKSSLNGLYLNGTDKDPNHYAAGIIWQTWKGYQYSLTKSEMKIRLW